MTTLAQLLASFQKENPQVTYQIYSGNADHIKERLEGGALDLGLLLEPVDISRYDFLRLPTKECWGVHVREDSPLASKEIVTAEDLVGIPLIVTRRGLVQRELQRWFGPHADRIQICASGNLPYNMAQLAGRAWGRFSRSSCAAAMRGCDLFPYRRLWKRARSWLGKRRKPSLPPCPPFWNTSKNAYLLFLMIQNKH